MFGLGRFYYLRDVLIILAPVFWLGTLFAAGVKLLRRDAENAAHLTGQMTLVKKSRSLSDFARG